MTFFRILTYFSNTQSLFYRKVLVILKINIEITNLSWKFLLLEAYLFDSLGGKPPEIERIGSIANRR